MVWANGLFVAVGANGTVITSPDGVTWTARSSGTTLTLNEVISCDHTFLAAGASQLIMETLFSGPPVMGARRTGSGFEVGLSGEIGAAYRVQTATDPSPAQWSDWLTITNVERTTFFQDGTTTNAPRRFYRAVTP